MLALAKIYQLGAVCIKRGVHFATILTFSCRMAPWRARAWLQLMASEQQEGPEGCKHNKRQTSSPVFVRGKRLADFTASHAAFNLKEPGIHSIRC